MAKVSGSENGYLFGRRLGDLTIVRQSASRCQTGSAVHPNFKSDLVSAVSCALYCSLSIRILIWMHRSSLNWNVQRRLFDWSHEQLRLAQPLAQPLAASLRILLLLCLPLLSYIFTHLVYDPVDEPASLVFLIHWRPVFG